MYIEKILLIKFSLFIVIIIIIIYYYHYYKARLDDVIASVI